MEFGDVLFGFILFVMSPAAVFWGIAQIRKTKVGTPEAGRTGEMRASELRATIAAAVETATAGLSARITDLEERLGDEPVSAIRARVGGPPATGLDARAVSFDPDADLDDADGRPVQRRARA